MASAQTAGVPADVSRRSEEEEGNLAGIEQEDMVEPAQHGSGSVPVLCHPRALRMPLYKECKK